MKALVQVMISDYKSYEICPNCKLQSLAVLEDDIGMEYYEFCYSCGHRYEKFVERNEDGQEVFTEQDNNGMQDLSMKEICTENAKGVIIVKKKNGVVSYFSVDDNVSAQDIFQGLSIGGMVVEIERIVHRIVSQISLGDMLQADVYSNGHWHEHISWKRVYITDAEYKIA